MNQQPDKFFREKLHGYQRPAPGEAWERIAENLKKKRRGILWMRAAAAVLLLATASILLYPRMTTDPSTLVADNETPEQEPHTNRLAPSDTAMNPNSINPGANREPVVAVPNETPVESRSAKRETGVRKQPQVIRPVQEVTIPSSESPEVTQKTVVDVIPESNFAVTSDEETVESSIDQKSQNITIIFTAEEVNEKYLAKNTDAEATPDTEETSGLRKLLDKAYDLKHNRDFLGELRQKKNEILAMNFKNDKRTQND